MAAGQSGTSRAVIDPNLFQNLYNQELQYTQFATQQAEKERKQREAEQARQRKANAEAMDVFGEVPELAYEEAMAFRTLQTNAKEKYQNALSASPLVRRALAGGLTDAERAQLGKEEREAIQNARRVKNDYQFAVNLLQQAQERRNQAYQRAQQTGDYSQIEQIQSNFSNFNKTLQETGQFNPVALEQLVQGIRTEGPQVDYMADAIRLANNLPEIYTIKGNTEERQLTDDGIEMVKRNLLGQAQRNPTVEKQLIADTGAENVNDAAQIRAEQLRFQGDKYLRPRATGGGGRNARPNFSKPHFERITFGDGTTTQDLYSVVVDKRNDVDDLTITKESLPASASGLPENVAPILKAGQRGFEPVLKDDIPDNANAVYATGNKVFSIDGVPYVQATVRLTPPPRGGEDDKYLILEKGLDEDQEGDNLDPSKLFNTFYVPADMAMIDVPAFPDSGEIDVFNP